MRNVRFCRGGLLGVARFTVQDLYIHVGYSVLGLRAQVLGFEKISKKLSKSIGNYFGGLNGADFDESDLELGQK